MTRRTRNLPVAICTRVRDCELEAKIGRLRFRIAPDADYLWRVSYAGHSWRDLEDEYARERAEGLLGSDVAADAGRGWLTVADAVAALRTACLRDPWPAGLLARMEAGSLEDDYRPYGAPCCGDVLDLGEPLPVAGEIHVGAPEDHRARVRRILTEQGATAARIELGVRAA